MWRARNDCRCLFDGDGQTKKFQGSTKKMSVYCITNLEKGGKFGRESYDNVIQTQSLVNLFGRGHFTSDEFGR